MIRTGDIYWHDLTSKGPLVDWLLPGFLPRGALIAMAGMAGAGKSVLLYTIAQALAAGVPVLGMTPPRPTRVLYFDDENSQADRTQYLQWSWKGIGAPPRYPLTDNFVSASFMLGTQDWADIAATLVTEYQPELIVIDTTTPCCAIQDENHNGEASAAITDLRRLQSLVHPTATLIALKHAKVLDDNQTGASGGNYTLRGAKAWEGAVDGVLFVVRDRGRPRKDGLTNVRIIPKKTRAFGLRTPLHIHAAWRGTTAAGNRALVLERIQETEPEV